MEQVQTREAIRDEGAQAARDGKPMSACRFEEGTDARDEWEDGYCQACARAVVSSSVAIRVAA